MQNGIEKNIKDGKAARTAGFVCLGLCAVAMILVIICGSDVRAYQGLVARLERNPVRWWYYWLRLRYLAGWFRPVVVTVFLTLPTSIILFILSGARAPRAARYKKYLALIPSQPALEEMSIAVGLPPNKVKRDISTMIRERCIDGEELEAARRMLLAHHRGQSGADGAKEVSVAGALCPACGAPIEGK